MSANESVINYGSTSSINAQRASVADCEDSLEFENAMSSSSSHSPTRQLTRNLSRRLSSATDLYGRRAAKPPKVCQTCRGSGFLSDDGAELVALIPHGDSRLKPNYTKHYAGVAVALCLVLAVILTFFLFPRSSSFSTVAEALMFNATSDTTMLFTLQLDMNISNNNYFSLDIDKSSVFVVMSTVVVGSIHFNDTFSVAARDVKKVRRQFTLSIVNRQFVDRCTIEKYGTIFLEIRILLSTSFLDSASQLTGNTFNFFVCQLN